MDKGIDIYDKGDDGGFRLLCRQLYTHILPMQNLSVNASGCTELSNIIAKKIKAAILVSV